MKFIFKNLGPIHEAELELGDLTILAGRNNTGKTYVAYTLYGFLKMLPYWDSLSEFFDELRQKTQGSDELAQVPDIKKLAETIIEEGQATWSIDRKTLNLLQKGVVREIARVFSEAAFPKVFNSPHKEFEGASFEAVLEEAFPEKVSSRNVSFTTGDEFIIKYSDAEIQIRSVKIVGGKHLFNVSSSLSALFLSFLFPKLPNPFILSAERFGISLFYKELDLPRGAISAISGTKKDNEGQDSLPILFFYDTPSQYTLPIVDNIKYTKDLSKLRKRQGKLSDAKLFNDIKDMLGGYYRSSDNEIRFKSKARKDGFDIPLHLASSSARGLSDLYFFLRHVAKKNQLLIIDEPESHLDTANQIQFARLLAHAVHAGLKVLITTHSDYIVKEINNLLMLGQEFEEKDEVRKELGYSKHDFLKPESVRAYVAKDNSLKRCTIDRYGINMPVFDTTIDAINRVSNELSVRLKYEGEG